MNILVIAPHPDDEILGVGGTIAKYIDHGHDVYICIVTRGHISMFSEESVNQVRQETLNAHEYIGVKKTFFLDFPSVMLHSQPLHEINAKIEKVVLEVKPTVAYIPHFGDMHTDHFIVAEASMVALRPIGTHVVNEIYSYETLSETEWNIPHAGNAFLINSWNNITGYLDTKLSTMTKFESQLKEFPHPRSIKALRSLANLRGSTIGVEEVEAFSLIRKIDN